MHQDTTKYYSHMMNVFTGEGLTRNLHLSEWPFVLRKSNFYLISSSITVRIKFRLMGPFSIVYKSILSTLDIFLSKMTTSYLKIAKQE